MFVAMIISIYLYIYKSSSESLREIHGTPLLQMINSDYTLRHTSPNRQSPYHSMGWHMVRETAHSNSYFRTFTPKNRRLTAASWKILAISFPKIRKSFRIVLHQPQANTEHILAQWLRLISIDRPEFSAIHDILRIYLRKRPEYCH